MRQATSHATDVVVGGGGAAGLGRPGAVGGRLREGAGPLQRQRPRQRGVAAAEAAGGGATPAAAPGADGLPPGGAARAEGAGVFADARLLEDEPAAPAHLAADAAGAVLQRRRLRR